MFFLEVSNPQAERNIKQKLISHRIDRRIICHQPFKSVNIIYLIPKKIFFFCHPFLRLLIFSTLFFSII